MGLRLSRNGNLRQARFFGVCFLIAALAWKWQAFIRLVNAVFSRSQPEVTDQPASSSPKAEAVTSPHDGSPIHDAGFNRISREQVEAALNKLTPREREIIQIRYGMDDGSAHTLEEVGKRFGLSREQVRHIEIRALSKLRRMRRRNNQA